MIKRPSKKIKNETRREIHFRKTKLEREREQRERKTMKGKSQTGH